MADVDDPEPRMARKRRKGKPTEANTRPTSRDSPLSSPFRHSQSQRISTSRSRAASSSPSVVSVASSPSCLSATSSASSVVSSPAFSSSASSPSSPRSVCSVAETSRSASQSPHTSRSPSRASSPSPPSSPASDFACSRDDGQRQPRRRPHPSPPSSTSARRAPSTLQDDTAVSIRSSSSAAPASRLSVAAAAPAVVQALLEERQKPRFEASSASSGSLADEIEQLLAFAPHALDAFQLAGASAALRGESAFVVAHTSAGKSLVASLAAFVDLRRTSSPAAERPFAPSLPPSPRTPALEPSVLFLSPLKALSNQKHRELERLFGASTAVGLLTGDERKNLHANPEILVATAEIIRNEILKAGSDVTLLRRLRLVVMDEFHFFADAKRGTVWEELLLLLREQALRGRQKASRCDGSAGPCASSLPPPLHFIFLSASLEQPTDFASWFTLTFGQPLHLIGTKQRPVPLEFFGLFASSSLSSGDSPPALHRLLMAKRRSEASVRPAGWNENRAAGGAAGEGSRDQPQELSVAGGAAQDFQFDRSAYMRAAETASRTGEMGVGRKGEKRLTFPQVPDHAVVQALRVCIQRRLLPALVFCFSRKHCLSLAEQLASSVGAETPLLERHQLACMYAAADAGVSCWRQRPPAEATKSLLSLLEDEVEEEGGLSGEEELRRREEEDAQRQLEVLKPLFLRGIGVHNAGLLPPVKELVEKAFELGLLRVTVCTETFSAGLNLPARSVIFASLFKPVDPHVELGGGNGLRRPPRAVRAPPLSLSSASASADVLPSDEGAQVLVADALFCRGGCAEDASPVWMRRLSPAEVAWTEERSGGGARGAQRSSGVLAWRLLSRTEFEQMAGRAGRRGIDDKGTVILLLPSPAPPPEALETLFASPALSSSSSSFLSLSAALSLRSRLRISFQTLLLLQESVRGPRGDEQVEGEEKEEKEGASRTSAPRPEQEDGERHEDKLERELERLQRQEEVVSCGETLDELLLNSFYFFSVTMHLPCVLREIEAQRRALRLLAISASERRELLDSEGESFEESGEARDPEEDSEGERRHSRPDTRKGKKTGRRTNRGDEEGMGFPAVSASRASSFSRSRVKHWSRQAARCMRLVEKQKKYRGRLDRHLRSAFSDTFRPLLQPGAVVLLVQTSDAVAAPMPWEKKRKREGLEATAPDKANGDRLPPFCRTGEEDEETEEDALGVLHDSRAFFALRSQTELSTGGAVGSPGRRESGEAPEHLFPFFSKKNEQKTCWGWGLVLGASEVKNLPGDSADGGRKKTAAREVFVDCLVACTFVRARASPSSKFACVPLPFQSSLSSSGGSPFSSSMPPCGFEAREAEDAEACDENATKREGSAQTRFAEFLPGDRRQAEEDEIARSRAWAVEAAEQATKAWAERVRGTQVTRRKKLHESEEGGREEREGSESEEAKVHIAVLSFGASCVKAVSQIHIDFQNGPDLDLRREDERLSLFVSMAEALRTAAPAAFPPPSSSSAAPSPSRPGARIQQKERYQVHFGGRRKEKKGGVTDKKAAEEKAKPTCACGVPALHGGTDLCVPLVPLLDLRNADARLEVLHERLRAVNEKLQETLRVAICGEQASRGALERFCRFVVLRAVVLPRLERLAARAPTALFRRVEKLQHALFLLGFLELVQEETPREVASPSADRYFPVPLASSSADSSAASPPRSLRTTRKGTLAGRLFYFEERALVFAEILDCMRQRLSTRLRHAPGKGLSSAAPSWSCCSSGSSSASPSLSVVSSPASSSFVSASASSSSAVSKVIKSAPSAGRAASGREGRRGRSEPVAPDTPPDDLGNCLSLSPGSGVPTEEEALRLLWEPEEKMTAVLVSFLPAGIDALTVLAAAAGLCGDGRGGATAFEREREEREEEQRKRGGELRERGDSADSLRVGKHVKLQEFQIEEEHDLGLATRIIQTASAPISAAWKTVGVHGEVVARMTYVDRQAMRDVYRWVKSADASLENEGGYEAPERVSFTLRRLASALRETDKALLAAYGRDDLPTLLLRRFVKVLLLLLGRRRL
ncbi:hypothetical protein BESB_078050 [Besnoitia besnoiti]|uniref:Helicase ATP-binding domain-containing protein n=1 Tax=Besnoitia besnoiti TaxID=94643 RepID=A0A2A9M523_BESBE|nr:hypothetical protein BESB_078050 [Besnoitia besnoiti]PFH33588.1 hypothetical protein BESB_078050 [Besnoitia besnoiti]